MSTPDNSYHRLLIAFRERNQYNSVFQRSLDELSGKVDFGWVTSCVSLGTGCGAHELPFARRFLPNLRTFVAVEPDRESVKALRTSFQVVFTMLLLNIGLKHFLISFLFVSSRLRQSIIITIVKFLYLNS